MKKINKKQISFPAISIVIILFFSTIILLHLPTIFKFKSLESKIEKLFFSEYNLYLDIDGEISYKVFPSPHLLISKGNISIYKNIDNEAYSDFKDMKIFVPLKQLYIRNISKVNKAELSNINLKLKVRDIIFLRDHLYSKINKKLHIKNSNIFVLNNNNEIILISPTKNINYFLDEKNKVKKLEISGNIFDTNYLSEWERDYLKPETSHNLINLEKLNVKIKNYLTIINNKHFKGGTNIKLINEEFILDYEYLENKILISSPQVKKNNFFRLNANINLNPFYFDSKIEIHKKKINFLIDNVIKYIFIYDKDLLGNVSGKLVIKLVNLDNPFIKQGQINLSINEKKIEILNSSFDLEKIGKLNSDLSYIIENSQIYFHSKNELQIQNNKELVKFLQFNSKEISSVKKIFFEVSKKLNDQEIIISNIKLIDNLNSEFLIKNPIQVKNIQNLKYEIRKSLN